MSRDDWPDLGPLEPDDVRIVGYQRGAGDPTTPWGGRYSWRDSLGGYNRVLVAVDGTDGDTHFYWLSGVESETDLGLAIADLQRDPDHYAELT